MSSEATSNEVTPNEVISNEVISNEPIEVNNDDNQAVAVETTEETQLPKFVEINETFDALEIDSELEKIAKTNQLEITWEKLQEIIENLIQKQYNAIKENLTDEETKKIVDELIMKITHSIHDHSNCPFTIQRLCELLIEPKKYYKVYIKYLRAVKKVLLVTSYWEDYANKGDDVKDIDTNQFELEPHDFEQDEEQVKNDSKMELD